MKKPMVISLIAIVIIITMGILCFGDILGKRPFKELDSNNILGVSVSVFPPDMTIEIQNEEEIKELVSILKTVVIYGEDDSAKDYTGQLGRFTLPMNDGSMLEVGAYNPFIFIDGVGYKTKYEPCEELSALGNKLINENYIK